MYIYLQQFPRGTASLSLSALELPPLYYCQSQRTGCTPAHRYMGGGVLLTIVCPDEKLLELAVTVTGTYSHRAAQAKKGFNC